MGSHMLPLGQLLPVGHISTGNEGWHFVIIFQTATPALHQVMIYDRFCVQVGGFFYFLRHNQRVSVSWYVRTISCWVPLVQ